MKIHERVEAIEKLQHLSDLDPSFELQRLGVRADINGDETLLCVGVLGDSPEEIQKSIYRLAVQLGIRETLKTEEIKQGKS